MGEAGARWRACAAIIAISPCRDRPIRCERRKCRTIFKGLAGPRAENSPTAHPLIRQNHRKRISHLQRVRLAHQPHRGGGGDGEGVDAGQARGRAEEVTGHRVQGQTTGQGPGGDPVIRTLADGAHLVAIGPRPAVRADAPGEVRRGQFARGRGLLIRDHGPARAHRQAPDCVCGRVSAAVCGVTPGPHAAIGFLRHERTIGGVDRGEAGARGLLAGAAKAGIAPRKERAIVPQGGERLLVGIDLGVAGGRCRALAAAAGVTPRDNGAIGL